MTKRRSDVQLSKDDDEDEPAGETMKRQITRGAHHKRRRLNDASDEIIFASSAAFSIPTPTTVQEPPSEPLEVSDQLVDVDVPERVQADPIVWNVQHKLTRARYSKLIEEDGIKQWKPFLTGPLRLEQGAGTDHKRLIMYDCSGRVQLNVAIVRGMTFKYVTQEREGKERRYVQFSAVQDPDDGVEVFMTQIELGEADSYVKELRKMVM